MAKIQKKEDGESPGALVEYTSALKPLADYLLEVDPSESTKIVGLRGVTERPAVEKPVEAPAPSSSTESKGT